MKLTGMFKLDTRGSTTSVVRLAEVYQPSESHPIGTEVYMARVHFDTLGLTPDDTFQVTIEKATVQDGA